MKGTVKIGSIDVGMTANAASPYFFKQIFGQDFFRESQKDDFDPEIFQKMAFVMAMQDAKKTSEMLKLNQEAYVEWLVQFDPMDFMDASTDIATFYTAQKKTTSTPKRKGV